MIPTFVWSLTICKAFWGTLVHVHMRVENVPDLPVLIDMSPVRVREVPAPEKNDHVFMNSQARI